LRDPGPNYAIDTAGGVAQLAHKIGVAQPSASNWNRVPAQRVIAIEAATGASHKQLRSDLSSEPAVKDDAVDPVDAARAQAYAAEMSASLGIDVAPAGDLGASVRESDVCVTCTPSRRPFVSRDDVAAGTFIAAVGADHRGKQELEPTLVASSTLVVDVLEQCAEIGELQHVLAARLMTREQVHAELADVVTGRRPGRTQDDEITIFDSSGTALQDVAAAVGVYEHARATGRGTDVTLDA